MGIFTKHSRKTFAESFCSNKLRECFKNMWRTFLTNICANIQKILKSVYKGIISKHSYKTFARPNKNVLLTFGQRQFVSWDNGKTKYEMNGKYLAEVIEERDLGVIVQNDLKCSSQCIKAVNTANRVLGMIKRTLRYYFAVI